MNISVIGAGAMGCSIAEGLVAAGVEPRSIVISDLMVSKRVEKLIEKGCELSKSNAEAASKADLLIIAVKPWILISVASELSNVIDCERTHVAVVVAGLSGTEVASMFGDKLSRLTIVMPNTAVAVRRSMTFLVDVAGGRSAKVEKIFKYLGEVKWINEALLPAATALASSGIAFAMRYARVSAEGGVELGFTASEAHEIVAQTMIGASELLLQPGSHPEAEIDKVTTPGGITIKGLNAMEKEGFSRSVIAGLKACVGR